MAHTCPDCGQTCYCRGDIDDCILDGTDSEAFCVHCIDAGGEDDDYDPALDGDDFDGR